MPLFWVYRAVFLVPAVHCSKGSVQSIRSVVATTIECLVRSQIIEMKLVISYR